MNHSREILSVEMRKKLKTVGLEYKMLNSPMKMLFQKNSNFANDKSGLAAIEFALILPIMLGMFFIALEANIHFSVNKRVDRAAAMLGDLASQAIQISPQEINSLFIGVTEVIEPIDIMTLEMSLVHVIPDPNTGAPVVKWSRSSDPQNDTPYQPGDPFFGLNDNAVLRENFSIIYGVVSYSHDSGLAGQALSEVFHYEVDEVRTPRRSNDIDLCTLTSQGQYIDCI